MHRSIRTLYERGVTIAAIVDTPENAERFVEFQWINWAKIRRAAIDVLGEQQVDATIDDPAVIVANYQRVKPLFTSTHVRVCKNCSFTTQNDRVEKTWGPPLIQMVQALGDRWKRLYFSGNVVPNLIIHSTGFSMSGSSPDGMILHSMQVLLLIVRAINYMLEANLYDEIGRCERDAAELVMDPKS